MDKYNKIQLSINDLSKSSHKTFTMISHAYDVLPNTHDVMLTEDALY